MLNLLSLLIGGLVIAGIARYNKSNKLFWELMMSFLFGFACGHVGKSYKAYTDKKPGITVVTAMQPSQALTVIDGIFDSALPTDICVLNESDSNVAPAMAKVALAENDNCRDIIPARDHLTFNAENDIGMHEPINSS
jgi:hypothetical protein